MTPKEIGKAVDSAADNIAAAFKDIINSIFKEFKSATNGLANKLSAQGKGLEMQRNATDNKASDVKDAAENGPLKTGAASEVAQGVSDDLGNIPGQAQT